MMPKPTYLKNYKTLLKKDMKTEAELILTRLKKTNIYVNDLIYIRNCANMIIEFADGYEVELKNA